MTSRFQTLLEAMQAASTGGLQVVGQPFRPWREVAEQARDAVKTVRSGQRTGISLPSGPELIAALVAIVEGGGVALPLSPQWPEAARQRIHTRFRLDGESPLTHRVAILSSGSTGEPAAVVLSQRALLANAEDIVESLGLTPGDRTLCIPPMHGAYGLSVVTSHVLAAATVVIEPRSAFPATLIQSARELEVTCISAVPTTWRLFLRQPPLAIPSLRLATVAGGALSVENQQQLRSSVPLYVMYGQTEASARLTCLSPSEFNEAPTSCGRPLRRVELRIADDGEVLARGPNLMDGYLDDDERTREVLRDGWLHTGDLGRLDGHGRLHLTGRKKWMLKVGEMRVAPLQVEAVLTSLPGVHEAVIVGIPDALLGEVPLCFFTGSADEKTVLDGAAPLLAPWERPRRAVKVDTLPTLPGGKIDVRALQRAALQV